MPWLIVGLVLVGLVWWERSSKAAGAKVSAAAASSDVVPLSDSQAIYAARMNLASAYANKGLAGGTPGLTYTIGQAQTGAGLDPQFAAALAVFQKYANSLGDFAKAGLPFDSLRTDGVLDYATAAALNLYVNAPPSSSSVPPGGLTSWTLPMAVLLRPGNVGVVALPKGVPLQFMLPSMAAPVASGVTSDSGGLLNTVPYSALASSGAPLGYTVQPADSFYASPGVIGVTVSWIDSTGMPQTSTVQIIAAIPGAFLQLTPSTMPDVYIPENGGTLMFVAPAGGTVQSGTNNANGGIDGAVYPPAAGSSSASWVVSSVFLGSSSMVVSWTDASGSTQTSNFNVFSG
jgi:hypothetical protein